MKDNTTGRRIAGVPVTLAFQGQGVVNPTGITDANGNYSLGPVPAGSYGKLTVNGAGYVPISTAVTVAASGSKADFQVTRDWAAASGGGTVVDFNGPDYTEFGCGPVHAIDTSLSTGWGSITGNRERPTNLFRPKFITVAMPQKVNITQFAVDPSATCGDAGSSSTGAYRIETSPDNVTWTEAASGTFVADRPGAAQPRHTDHGRAGRAVREVLDPGQPGAGLRDQLPERRVRRLHLHRPDRAAGLRRRDTLTRLTNVAGGRPSGPAAGLVPASGHVGDQAAQRLTWSPTALRPFAVSATHVVRRPWWTPLRTRT